jgi:hypothetical protein
VYSNTILVYLVSRAMNIGTAEETKTHTHMCRRRRGGGGVGGKTSCSSDARHPRLGLRVERKKT